jgi:Tfp pilus assembly protein PilV
MSPTDPVLLSILLVIVAILAWQYLQIRSLARRLQSLEKQHLALIEDLEERLYNR